MTNMIDLIVTLLEKTLRVYCPSAEGLPDSEDLKNMIEIPPSREMGDYAFPCFRLSRTLRKAPPVIASELKERFNGDGICTAVNLNGYLNFFLNKPFFAETVIRDVESRGDLYGGGTEGNGRTICLDFSSINIAKRFHIGHLYTTLIGHSLKRVFQFLGYDTVGINHLGDWGTQFGNMISAYKRFGSAEMIEEGGVQALTDLYVLFHEKADTDDTLEEEGRSWFRKIENGDPEAVEIFTRFKEITFRETRKIYDRLGVVFDSYAGESFYQDKMDRVIKELTDKALLTVSDGASIVDLEPYDMPPCLILKKDGTTLYATRDIAAVLYRYDTYRFDKCLYVVAYQQDLHFRQLFKVIELMGYPYYCDLVHVSYGMVSFNGKVLSTRKGNMVYLDEILDLVEEKALGVINGKNPDLPDKETVAAQVGIGAVIYQTLSSSRIKDIDFNVDRALAFEGETGPYVQYTHAKCCTLLSKAASVDESDPDWSALTNEEAQNVLHLISRFPDAVREAASKYEPFMITRAITDICHAYNRFYSDHRIIGDDISASAARVKLTRAVRDIIRRGLFLIGMEAPERM